MKTIAGLVIGTGITVYATQGQSIVNIGTNGVVALGVGIIIALVIMVVTTKRG